MDRLVRRTDSLAFVKVFGLVSIGETRREDGGERPTERHRGCTLWPYG